MPLRGAKGAARCARRRQKAESDGARLSREGAAPPAPHPLLRRAFSAVRGLLKLPLRGAFFAAAQGRALPRSLAMFRRRLKSIRRAEKQRKSLNLRIEQITHIHSLCTCSLARGRLIIACCLPLCPPGARAPERVARQPGLGAWCLGDHEELGCSVAAGGLVREVRFYVRPVLRAVGAREESQTRGRGEQSGRRTVWEASSLGSRRGAPRRRYTSGCSRQA